MLPLCRIADKNNGGGVVLTGAATVFADFRPVAFVGSTISDHPPYGPPHPPHAAAVITSGNPTVMVEFRPVARVSSTNSCGHTMADGSLTVRTL